MVNGKFLHFWRTSAEQDNIAGDCTIQMIRAKYYQCIPSKLLQQIFYNFQFNEYIRVNKRINKRIKCRLKMSMLQRVVYFPLNQINDRWLIVSFFNSASSLDSNKIVRNFLIHSIENSTRLNSF